MDPQAKAVLDKIARLSATPMENSSDAQWLVEFRCGVAGLRAFAPEPEQRPADVARGRGS